MRPRFESIVVLCYVVDVGVVVAVLEQLQWASTLEGLGALSLTGRNAPPSATGTLFPAANLRQSLLLVMQYYPIWCILRRPDLGFLASLFHTGSLRPLPTTNRAVQAADDNYLGHRTAHCAPSQSWPHPILPRRPQHR